MKKVLLMCLIVLGVSTLSKAQGGGQRAPQTPETMTDRMDKAVTLTADQKTKVMAIYKMQIASQDSLTKAGNTDRAAMMPIRARYTAMVKAVLTPDQQAKMPPAGGRGGGGGQGGGGGTPPPTR